MAACTNCGYQTFNGELYCPQCGNMLQNALQQAPQIQIQQGAQLYQNAYGQQVPQQGQAPNVNANMNPMYNQQAQFQANQQGQAAPANAYYPPADGALQYQHPYQNAGYPNNAQYAHVQQMPPSQSVQNGYAGSKSRVTAALLAIFLGGLGIHKFYLGQNLGGFPIGVIYILLCWTWIPAIIALIEGVIYLTKSDAEFYQIYVVEKRAMF